MKSGARDSRTAIAAMIALFAIAFTSLQLLFAVQPHGFTGAWIEGIDGTVREVFPESSAARSGLVAGDRIALGALSLRERLQLSGGAILSYARVPLRGTHADGTPFATEITIAPYAPAEPNLLGPGLRVLAFAITVAIGVTLVAMSGSSVAWLFFAFTLVTAPTYTSLLASAAFPELAMRIATIVALVPLAGGYVLAAFFARATEAHGAPWTTLQRGMLFAAGVASVVAIAEGLAYTHLTRAWLEIPRDFGYLIAYPVLLLRLRTVERAQRDRYRLIAAGSIVVFAAQAASVAFSDAGRFGPLDALASGRIASALGTATVIFPCVVASALTSARVGDARKMLAGAASRAFVIAALAIAALGLVGFVATIAGQPALLAPLLAIVAIAFGLTVRSFFLAMHRREEPP